MNLKKQHKQSFYVICKLTETILLYIIARERDSTFCKKTK